LVLDDKLVIREPLNTEEFESMYNLRWKILRKPWNQPKGSEIDDKEGEAYSFIAILKGNIIGTARFHKISDIKGQIRYLAIDESFRNLGIGTSLMKHIESYAKKQGIKTIILNARKTAKAFFDSFDYYIISEGPLLYNEIEHFVMVKDLF
jgi:N-acetylglutamate synthase-like GNAT family acetyltransferase